MGLGNKRRCKDVPNLLHARRSVAAPRRKLPELFAPLPRHLSFLPHELVAVSVTFTCPALAIDHATWWRSIDLYGSTLRLPGEFLEYTTPPRPQPQRVRHPGSPSTSTSVRRSQPSDFTTWQYFQILLTGREETVSVDRRKAEPIKTKDDISLSSNPHTTGPPTPSKPTPSFSTPIPVTPGPVNSPKPAITTKANPATTQTCTVFRPICRLSLLLTTPSSFVDSADFGFRRMVM